MLWFVFNDYLLHTESTLPPMQVEVQCTVFGFNCQESPLGNTVFVQYRIKSCSSENLDSAYFGLFADFSIGNPEDDFFGSDAERALIFGYRGTASRYLLAERDWCQWRTWGVESGEDVVLC
jgi:hypothetical protein